MIINKIKTNLMSLEFGNIEILISYSTVVAMKIRGEWRIRRPQYYSTTTSKHFYQYTGLRWQNLAKDNKYFGEKEDAVLEHLNALNTLY